MYPSDHFKVSYTISFDHPLLRHQTRTERITEQSFTEHIASARTFGFLKEVEWLRQQGLALGGSLENAIVIGDTGVLNALRFDDEFVRHKILDVVGDLALVGYPFVGHVVAHRAGQRCTPNSAGRSSLIARPGAWSRLRTWLPRKRSSACRPLRAPTRLSLSSHLQSPGRATPRPFFCPQVGATDCR